MANYGFIPACELDLPDEDRADIRATLQAMQAEMRAMRESLDEMRKRVIPTPPAATVKSTEAARIIGVTPRQFSYLVRVKKLVKPVPGHPQTFYTSDVARVRDLIQSGAFKSLSSPRTSGVKQEA